jgi:hypothetical protein
MEVGFDSLSDCICNSDVQLLRCLLTAFLYLLMMWLNSRRLRQWWFEPQRKWVLLWVWSIGFNGMFQEICRTVSHIISSIGICWSELKLKKECQQQRLKICYCCQHSCFLPTHQEGVFPGLVEYVVWTFPLFLSYKLQFINYKGNQLP